eukprot:2805576-Pleurochrysis_carterae.AAC.1
MPTPEFCVSQVINLLPGQSTRATTMGKNEWKVSHGDRDDLKLHQLSSGGRVSGRDPTSLMSEDEEPAATQRTMRRKDQNPKEPKLMTT